ncbi:MAG: hypothetical protein FWF54_04235 [Candidatus Azobacteroides sp.]|jgi:hypothetical protein|nr:hypothetical protein [Candidatus Azobacteroides sp.]
MGFLGFGKSKRQAHKHKKEFKDSPDTAVFTTKFVTEDKADITYVCHDADDGAWQFFSEDRYEDFAEIARLASLKEIISLDDSVLEIADLPEGYFAFRPHKRYHWMTKKQE